MLLAYNPKFIKLNISRFKYLDSKELADALGEPAVDVALLLQSALRSDCFADALRFYVNIDMRQAKYLSLYPEKYNPAAAFSALKVYSLKINNREFLKSRREAKSHILNARKDLKSAEPYRQVFRKKFLVQARPDADLLFDALILKVSPRSYSEETKLFVDYQYVEDSIDALIEKYSRQTQAPMCARVKRSLESDSNFNNPVLREALQTRTYSKLYEHIHRKDWPKTACYESQSTAILLWSLWERYGKDVFNG